MLKELLTKLNTPNVSKLALVLLVPALGVLAVPSQMHALLEELHIHASPLDVAVYSAIASSLFHRYTDVPRKV